MDFDVRIKALAQLAQSQTDRAREALFKALDDAATVLRTDTDYDRLAQAIKVLATIGHRRSESSVAVLIEFISNVEVRALTYSADALGWVERFPGYRSAGSLTIEAVEALTQLRYLELPRVLETLMSLARHADERVRRVADKGLRAVSEYNIDVFFGSPELRGIGATPQREIVTVLEGFTGRQLQENFRSVVMLMEPLLSPEMQGTRWASSNTVTFSHGPVPASSEVSEVRLRALTLLQRMYPEATSIEQRLQLIGELDGATRTSGDELSGSQWHEMYVRDAKNVLAFFFGAVRTTEWPVIQKIEHDSYWIYVHAISVEVEQAALEVKLEIDQNPEYEIYKTLIGFQGVFGDWEALRRESRHENNDGVRRAKAVDYVAAINDGNFAEWRARLLSFAQTRSNDLATFPIFYFFLETFATRHPTLALLLLREDADPLEQFLIPLLLGVWKTSSRPEVLGLMTDWVERGVHLYASAKLFESAPEVDAGLIDKILAKGMETDNRNVVRELISVAIANDRTPNRDFIATVFIPAVSYLTERGDASWAFDAWYRPEMRALIRSLDSEGIDLVLKNLASLDKIDYHIEELLSVIAEKAPEKVLQFFCDRLLFSSSRGRSELESYEATPYQLHKLTVPLAKIPSLAIQKLMEVYEKAPDLFVYRGGHFLKAIYPKFSPDFEAELTALIKRGGDARISFALAVLRNYEGELFIHDVCKEILRVTSGDRRFEGGLAIALQNTGVVHGEFGMAQVYEQKKKGVEPWLSDPNEHIRSFAQRFIEDMDSQILSETARANERIAIRKHQFGEE